MGLIDELTKSPAAAAGVGSVFGAVQNYAKTNLGAVGGTLVDEVGGRIGLGVSNAGPDAVASLSSTGRTGNPSPNLPSVSNARPKFDPFGWLTANWKLATGVAVVGAAVWWMAKRKRKG